MATMKEVLCLYKDRKFQKSVELIVLLKESYDDENFLLENCRLVCESNVQRDENDPGKILDMLEKHYLFFEKVISAGVHSNAIPLQLKLIATYNFTYWLLFYIEVEDEVPEIEEYLELINKGLLSVLGKEVQMYSNSFEKVLANLMSLKYLIREKEHKTIFLILELVIVVIVYVVKLKKSLVKGCLRVVTSFVEESKHVLPNEFSEVQPTLLNFCKFSVCKDGILLSELNSSVIDYLYILESVLLFLVEDYKGSLKSLQRNTHTSVNTLWNYLVIVNSYEVGNWNLCNTFLNRMSSLAISNSLKSKFHIMQGKLNCIGRQHKESLRQFQNALLLAPNCPTIYYYIGQEYGKMGLIDSMVENFEKLVQVIQFGLEVSENFKPNFESILLEQIHPVNEITEAEAHYVLAVSYGLNESFKEAAESFEKVLDILNSQHVNTEKRIIQLPSHLTVLHEASVINLLLGNLVRAEQISLDAIDRYVAQTQTLSGIRNSTVTSLTKDIEWLERVIQQELLDNESELKDLSNETVYTEDLLLCFPRNVIALLILSEIQRIQEVEDYKNTLGDIFTIFSKYLAYMKKKAELDEDEQKVLTLVKALTGKTCLRIAEMQINETNNLNVEKMYKRALSCNKGDRDALYNYYKFLLKAGKNREALKLWNTFSKEKVAIGLDSVHSFSLKYFLTDKVTNRDLDKIQLEIETADIIFP